ncbi:MAG: SUMF1/EgtB/PvdO family nonheme iron enzyme [Lewinellaceae bacterium]|nr:SUMF1/EgtB/PvdO family nonheme iron enzyme [Lewinellaceae bacterium]
MKKIYPFLLFIAALQVCTAQPPARSGKDYAVFFYVTDFQPGLKDLPDTKPEALALAKELSEHYGFSCTQVAECSKSKIQDELKAWNKRLGPDDQVLFFFSMHGYYDPYSDRGYLIPADGKADDQHNYFTTWLSYDDLRTYLAPCKAGHILVALDACYSGSFGIRSNRKPDEPAYEQEEMDCAAKLRQMMQYNGRQFITAGKKDESVPGKSAFTAEILKTLRTGYNEYGMILIDDLAYRLHKLKSPEPEDGSFVGHQAGGDFVFVRKNACAPAVASLDRDGDGVPDERDSCPSEFGTAKANGCPDRDNDGVPDKSDKCPDEAGKAYLEGCPEKDPYDLVLVTGGTFTMGCTSEQKDCDDDEKPAHQVTLSDYYIGKYEVTQKQWQQVMGSNPSNFKDCDDCPVELVSWDDVQAFLKKLNAGLPAGQKPYRLPTEAEWEYAARGGGGAALFGNGKNVADPNEINFDPRDSYKKSYSIAGDYRVKTVPVGSLNSPNALGLHDMSGNVWEWCSDWFDTYSSGAQTNPTGPASGSHRVLRGGSWGNGAHSARVAVRSGLRPDDRLGNVGFRLARTR